VFNYGVAYVIRKGGARGEKHGWRFAGGGWQKGETKGLPSERFDGKNS
jgi:hypothetical protein